MILVAVAVPKPRYPAMKLPNCLFALLLSLAPGQAPAQNNVTRPFKMYSAGKQLTLRSPKPMHRILVWTIEGDRLAEWREAASSQVTIELPVFRKVYFLMVVFADGKVWSGKIAAGY